MLSPSPHSEADAIPSALSWSNAYVIPTERLVHFCSQSLYGVSVTMELTFDVLEARQTGEEPEPSGAFLADSGNVFFVSSR